MRVISSETEAFSHDMREYVAELQLHMTLHARNLVPSLDNTSDHRCQLLHETQACLEKLASRRKI